MRLEVRRGGHVHEVELTVEDGLFKVTVDGTRHEIRRDGEVLTSGGAGGRMERRDGAPWFDGEPVLATVVAVSGRASEARSLTAPSDVRAPMNGRLERLLVKVGQTVAADEPLFVLEAMKMHNEVRSPRAGKVTSIEAKVGATLEPKDVVLRLS